MCICLWRAWSTQDDLCSWHDVKIQWPTSPSIWPLFEKELCRYISWGHAGILAKTEQLMQWKKQTIQSPFPNARFCGDQFELCECNISLILHKGHTKQSILNARFCGDQFELCECNILILQQAACPSNSKLSVCEATIVQSQGHRQSCQFYNKPGAKVIGKAVTVLQQTSPVYNHRLSDFFRFTVYYIFGPCLCIYDHLFEAFLFIYYLFAACLCIYYLFVPCLCIYYLFVPFFIIFLQIVYLFCLYLAYYLFVPCVFIICTLFV